MLPSDDPEAQADVRERQLGDTGEIRGIHAKTRDSAENYGDPSGKLWSMYLTEAKKEDDQITRNWTEDTNGVLVFTGLFSAIVASFISLSLPQLSPDSGNQTVALLTQLVNISTGAPVVLLENTPFEAPASIVRVNVLWFLSLILSLSCALLATLMQQWARRYLEYAQHRGAPRKQARIRAYMFEGVEKFGLAQAVEAMPLLLHSSVFLFFAGLIEYLLPINKVVAFSTLGSIVVFTSIYSILTLLPIWRLNCPYRTPLSWLTYTSHQLSVYSLLSVARAVEGTFHGFLLDFWQRSHSNRQGSRNSGPTKWRAILEDKVLTHYKRFSNGLRWSVVFGAMEASPSVDASALHWTLTTLDEDREFEDFAARMPGFFDSYAPSNATSAMLSLLSEQPTSEPILGSRLRDLLTTCLPGTSPLTEEQRNNRLRVCMRSLWYCLRAYNNSGVPLAPFVRAIFASPEVIGWIRTEEDPAIRLLGRCFGSLVVKKLSSDIASRTDLAGITEEMACLSYILGATGGQVRDWLDQDRAIDLVNVISLASGEFERLVTSGAEADVADVFQQTLGILAEGIVSGHSTDEWDDLPVDQVARFHHIYARFANAGVPDVLKDRLRYISDRLPPTSYLGEAEMEIPSIPEPDSETTPSSPSVAMSQTLRKLQVRIGGAPDSGFGGGSSAPTPIRD